MTENLKEIQIKQNKQYIPEGEEHLVTVGLISDIFDKDKVAILSWDKQHLVLKVPITSVKEAYAVINTTKRLKKRYKVKKK